MTIAAGSAVEMGDASNVAESAESPSVPPEPPQAAQHVVHLAQEAANLIESISALTEFSKRLLKVGKTLFHLSNLALELTCINIDYSAARAGKIVVRLEPSDRLACLLAASRARNIDSIII